MQGGRPPIKSPGASPARPSPLSNSFKQQNLNSNSNLNSSRESINATTTSPSSSPSPSPSPSPNSLNASPLISAVRAHSEPQHHIRFASNINDASPSPLPPLSNSSPPTGVPLSRTAERGERGERGGVKGVLTLSKSERRLSMPVILPNTNNASNNNNGAKMMPPPLSPNRRLSSPSDDSSVGAGVRFAAAPIVTTIPAIPPPPPTPPKKKPTAIKRSLSNSTPSASKEDILQTFVTASPHYTETLRILEQYYMASEALTALGVQLSETIEKVSKDHLRSPELGAQIGAVGACYRALEEKRQSTFLSFGPALFESELEMKKFEGSVATIADEKQAEDLEKARMQRFLQLWTNVLSSMHTYHRSEADFVSSMQPEWTNAPAEDLHAPPPSPPTAPVAVPPRPRVGRHTRSVSSGDNTNNRVIPLAKQENLRRGSITPSAATSSSGPARRLSAEHGQPALPTSHSPVLAGVVIQSQPFFAEDSTKVTADILEWCFEANSSSSASRKRASGHRQIGVQVQAVFPYRPRNSTNELALETGDILIAITTSQGNNNRLSASNEWVLCMREAKQHTSGNAADAAGVGFVPRAYIRALANS